MKILLEILVGTDSKSNEEVRLYFEDETYIYVDSHTNTLLRDILAQAIRRRKDVLASIVENLQGK